MALHDLKKKPQASRRKTSYDVDSFIDEAELYAHGCAQVITLPTRPRQAPRHDSYKNATFSLTLSTIDELEEIKQQTGINKSALLRAFSRYLSDLTAAQRQQILSLAKTRL